MGAREDMHQLISIRKNSERVRRRRAESNRILEGSHLDHVEWQLAQHKTPEARVQAQQPLAAKTKDSLRLNDSDGTADSEELTGAISPGLSTHSLT